MEYAIKATENANTILGIVCKDGVMIGSEKLILSDMLVTGSDRRIYQLAKHIGMAVTGLIPDGRALVERAKEECASFQKQYGIPITGKVLAERIGQVVHFNTYNLSARPYGCAVIIASFDPINGPALNLIDSSGQCFGYFGCAAGKGRQIARNEIEKLGPKNMACKEAAFHFVKMYLDKSSSLFNLI